MFIKFLTSVLLLQLIICISSVHANPIRYVAIGDSYTVGARVEPDDSWPFQLTQRLNSTTLQIELIANLGRTVWTAQQVANDQLPKLKSLDADFVTLLIGVNDWIRGVNNKDFTKRLQTLLDGIQNNISKPTNILLISIPDFSCTPGGKKWGYGKSAVNGIARLNKSIKTEADTRGLPLVDITPLSRELCTNVNAFANDGVHPSRM
jgi:acyl-CoA thioesterase-1